MAFLVVLRGHWHFALSRDQFFVHRDQDFCHGLTKNWSCVHFQLEKNRNFLKGHVSLYPEKYLDTADTDTAVNKSIMILDEDTLREELSSLTPPVNDQILLLQPFCPSFIHNTYRSDPLYTAVLNYLIVFYYNIT